MKNETVKVILIKRENNEDHIIFAQADAEWWHRLVGGSVMDENGHEVVPDSLFSEFEKGLKEC